MIRLNENFVDIFENTRKNPQLVHNITNYVTVNDCANILLAMGSSPIMADDIEEVEEITTICSALVINIGTLNSRTVESMIAAGKKANALGHPVVLDPVGAGASKLRTETTHRLLKEVNFSVIRGNISEIKTVYAGAGTTRGVDADVKDTVTDETLDATVALAKELSERTGAVIAITGAMDLITDSEKAYVVKNGHRDMSRITGTGCMLSAMTAAYAAANPDSVLEAVVCAVASMGIAGELASRQVTNNQLGTGSLRTFIMDNVSTMTGNTIETYAKITLIP
ncbi:hydroxyethylthiazole kinase [Eubacterium sp. 1001713B170207_170306_E7]|uniref:hydroxyethylthiazole kinase n=1 Tax=Eubacterium sp. 1001713B170207_170306_E7 TaxID=2787097 RepID=UPI00189B7677|nr:hydroxyethylthiazole kinase [Eubacterium sp. 1001713B170207_170306_E7]